MRKIEQALLDNGHHVCILTTTSGAAKHTHMNGEHMNRRVIFIDDAIPLAHTYDPHNEDNMYSMGFALSNNVKRQIEEFDPSLVHITVPDCTCLHLIDYARRKELPLMGTYHSNIPEYLKHYPGLGFLKPIIEGFFRHQYNFLQALYVPTPFIQKQLIKNLRMDCVTNLGVWGRGIDLSRFSRSHRSQKFRAQFGFKEDDVVLLWVGRLVTEKRPDIFVEVVRRLHKKKVPFRALVVGAGPAEDMMKSLPNTVFAGWMNGDDLATAYASSDVFLFPSAVETFGNVSLEAAASSLPVVLEEGCGGHLVRHGVSGFACNEHDVDAFFNSVLCLVMDDKRREEMGEEGRKLSENFDKETVCGKMIDNYSTITDEFYNEYDGRHANRDAIYLEKEHSFVSGNRTRPIPIVFAELACTLLFIVVYRLTVVFFYLRERMVFARPAPAGYSSAPRSESEVPVIVPMGIESQEESKVSSLSRIGREIEKGMENSDTTLSTISENSTSSMSFVPPPTPTEEPIHPSHRAAIFFMQFSYFLSRLECRARRAVSGARDVPRIQRKRKNSNFNDSKPNQSYSRSSVVRENSLSLRRSSSSNLVVG